mmetsp:Transcript_15366/g.32559  ORF Transcript_15366/g.32559 Transcript_15366/m.32559 type:complete len:202 (-) Transcript_15366:563-1168(-)
MARFSSWVRALGLRRRAIARYFIFSAILRMKPSRSLVFRPGNLPRSSGLEVESNIIFKERYCHITDALHSFIISRRSEIRSFRMACDINELYLTSSGMSSLLMLLSFAFDNRPSLSFFHLLARIINSTHLTRNSIAFEARKRESSSSASRSYLSAASNKKPLFSNVSAASLYLFSESSSSTSMLTRSTTTSSLTPVSFRNK